MARSTIEHTSKFMNQTRKLTSSDDMDNLTKAGFYTQADNDLPANAPSDNPYNAGIVVLKARNDAETIQIWFSVNSATCWFRCKPAYSSWKAWQKVMVGGVISKLLSEVMTASGGRHDEYYQKNIYARISNNRRREINYRLQQCSRSKFRVPSRIICIEQTTFVLSHGCLQDRVGICSARYEIQRRCNVFSHKRQWRLERLENDLNGINRLEVA